MYGLLLWMLALLSGLVRACQEPGAPTTVLIVDDFQNDGRTIDITVQSPGPANYNHFEVVITDYYNQTVVHENDNVTLDAMISATVPKFGTVYEFKVYTVLDCGNGTELKSADPFEDFYLTIPPKIDADVEVIFQNDSMLCALWKQSKDNANFDVVRTELQQPQGTTLDTVESQVNDEQEVGFQCFQSSQLNTVEFYSLKLTTRVTYTDGVQMTKNSVPGYRNLVFSYKDLQVHIDASHCDGDACLVNIEANQLPSKEDFDYQYQIFERSGSSPATQSGTFLGSKCDSDSVSCTYLVENLQPLTDYRIEVYLVLHGDQLPVLKQENFETGKDIPADPSPLSVDCDMKGEERYDCTVIITNDQLMDRFSFTINYNLTTTEVEIPPFHLGDTLDGQECDGNLASCIFDIGITLEKKSYTLILDVVFDDESVIEPELRGVQLEFTPADEIKDDSKASDGLNVGVLVGAIIGSVVAVIIIIGVIIIVVKKCACRKQEKEEIDGLRNFDYDERYQHKDDDILITRKTPDLEYTQPASTASTEYKDFEKPGLYWQTQQNEYDVYHPNSVGYYPPSSVAPDYANAQKASNQSDNESSVYENASYHGSEDLESKCEYVNPEKVDSNKKEEEVITNYNEYVLPNQI